MFEIIDEYGYKTYDYLNEVIEYTLKKLNSDGLLNVILIDDETMHEMNKAYRGIDRTTDVLSFAFNDNKRIETEINVLGDIYISIPKMNNVPSFGIIENDEFKVLDLEKNILLSYKMK